LHRKHDAVKSEGRARAILTASRTHSPQ
jgi:hypothetical protein